MVRACDMLYACSLGKLHDEDVAPAFEYEEDPSYDPELRRSQGMRLTTGMLAKLVGRAPRCPPSSGNGNSHAASNKFSTNAPQWGMCLSCTGES